MEAIIKHSPITCYGPIYSTYGNSPYLVAVYCTCCAKGSKANDTVTHANPTHFGTRGIPPSSCGSRPCAHVLSHLHTERKGTAYRSLPYL